MIGSADDERLDAEKAIKEKISSHALPDINLALVQPAIRLLNTVPPKQANPHVFKNSFRSIELKGLQEGEQCGPVA